ncbi:hypothetical protein IT575_09330 [bacterium]|nr:hypothetical protein [bacterium]
MSNRVAVAVVVSIALLATIGLLGYKVTQQFMRFQASEKLFQEVYSPKYVRPEKDAVKQDLDKIRAALKEHKTDRIEAMLVDKLAGVVWLYPDEANAALQEIFERAPRVTESQDMCPLVQASNYMLVWAYQCAVLPEQVEAGADLVVAKRPELRQTVRTLQAYTRVMADDLRGLEELAAHELEVRSSSMDARGFAMACEVLSGDYNAALEYQDSAAHGGIQDVNIRLLYIDLLVQQQRFDEAMKEASAIAARGSSSELSFSLAVPTYFTKGAGAVETRKLLEKMADSARNPSSVAGAEAWVLARLYEVTGRQEYAQRLVSLSSQHPDDYDVWAAQADSLMNRSMWLENEGTKKLLDEGSQRLAAEPGSKRNDTPQSSRPALSSANIARAAAQALGAARTEAQKLQSELISARSALYAGGISDSARKAMVLEHFAACLAPDPESGEPRNRVPDYDMLLTDLRLRELREQDHEFSLAIHGLVTDYIAGRLAYFQPAIDKGEQGREEYLEALKQPR